MSTKQKRKLDTSHIEKLIQQIQRKFCSLASKNADSKTESKSSFQVSRPCDAAAVAIGKEIGYEFLRLKLVLTAKLDNKDDKKIDSMNQQLQDGVLDMLCLESLSPTVSHSFFQVLTESIRNGHIEKERNDVTALALDIAHIFDFLPTWLIHMEQLLEQSHKNRRPDVDFLSSSPIANAVSGCIRTYSVYFSEVMLMDYNKSETGVRKNTTINPNIQDLWQRLQSKSSRLLLMKELVNAALCYPPQRTLQESSFVLTPLSATTLLGNNINCAEKQKVWMYILQMVTPIWRDYQEGTNIQRGTTTEVGHVVLTIKDSMKWIKWLTMLLDIFMCTLNNTFHSYDNDIEEAAAALEFAEMCFLEILELAWLPVQHLVMLLSNDDINESKLNPEILNVRECIACWISQDVLKVQLPKLLTAYIYSGTASGVSQKSIIDAVTDLLHATEDAYGEADDNYLQSPAIISVDSVTTLRICSLIMASPSMENRLALLQLLRACIQFIDVRSLPVAAALIRGASVQFSHDDSCQLAAAAAQSDLEDKIIKPSGQILTGKISSSINLMDLLLNWKPNGSDVTSTGSVTYVVAAMESFSMTNFSPIQQSSALLYGICLLECSGDSLGDKIAFKFLHNLISEYPHLGVSLLTVISVRLNRASFELDGKSLLQNLEFICTSLVTDSQSAQEVWKLVGIEWMNPQYSPLAVRVALLRLFPKLVEGNKRLYRRVIDYLTACLAGQELGIRLAAAASISDLAQKDLIRDVSDVIGHIQSLLAPPDESNISLTPIHSLLVHYALLTLHYLVVADELDFDVVIQVLKKKFCAITDLGGLLKLPLVVLESFVLLLGDGECSIDHDENVKQGRNVEEKPVSANVKAAVQALIHVATFVGDCDGNSDTNKKPLPDRDLIIRVKVNAYISLARYSLRALGANPDTLQSAIASAEKDNETASAREKVEHYEELQNLVFAGIEQIPADVDDAFDNALLELAGKLSQFEEDTLGVSLWQKRGKANVQKKAKATGAKPLSQRIANVPFIHESLSFLPTPQEALALSDKGPTVSNAILQLLTCDGEYLSVLRDNADGCIESLDPQLFILALQGYLHATSAVLNSQSFPTKSIVDEIGSWREILVSSDAMFLTLCSLSIFIPYDQQDGESQVPFVEEIFQRTLDTYTSHGFHKREISRICLGLLGVSSIRYADATRLHDIVELLEVGVNGYGGQHDFATFYALAMIAQAASHSIAGHSGQSSPIENSEIVRLISRTVGFVIEALLDCFELRGDVITGLLACLKTGVATPDLYVLLSQFGSDAIAVLNGKESIARELFICCSICLPALKSVSVELLAAMVPLFDAFEWGTGKGISLPPLFSTCSSLGALPPERIQDTYSAIVTLFDGRTDTSEKEMDANGLDDIFYSLNGTCWKPTPHEVCQIILQNRSLFDVNRFKVCLVALVNSFSSIFCFGGTDIWSLARLDSSIKENEIKDIISAIVQLSLQTKSEGDHDLSGFCAVVVGLLSSIKDIQKIVMVSNGLNDAKTKKLMSEGMDFSKLPRSTSGTMIASVIYCAERLLLTEEIDGVNESKLSRAIRSLKKISIPGQFAYFFLEPLLKEKVAVRACVELLCSQIAGRRRVYVEGGDFLRLLSEFFTFHSKGFLEDDIIFETFMESFHDVFPKFSIDQMNQILLIVWKKCIETKSKKSRAASLHKFLQQVQQLLSSNLNSSKVLSSVRAFVLQNILSDLSNESSDMTMTRTMAESQSILEVFSLCLKHIPVGVLEEDGRVFKSQLAQSSFHIEVFRIAVLLELLKMGYFETSKRSTQELATIASWLSKRIISTNEHIDFHTYCRLSFSFASATTTTSFASSKRDTLTHILDSLLLAADSFKAKMGLAWLGIVLAQWCSGNGSDSELSLAYLCFIRPDFGELLQSKAFDDFLSIVQNDLPYNFVSTSRREKMSAVVANYLRRLLEHWNSKGFDPDVIADVQRTVTLEHGNLRKDDAFLSVATDMLVKSIS